MARNGYLAEDGIKLVTVEDDDQLIATAAASFFAMRAAAARDGVSLFIVEPAGAYRRAWVQNDMVDNPARYNLNPNSKIRFGRSGQSHGWGNRIDVNSGALPWMLEHAHEFGWSREYGAKDPNHFKHDGKTAISGAGAGGGGIVTPPKRRRRTMTSHFINTSTLDSTGTATKNTVYAVAGDSPGTPANWREYTRGDRFGKGDDPYPRNVEAHGPIVDCNSAEWAALKADYLKPVSIAGGVPIAEVKFPMYGPVA